MKVRNFLYVNIPVSKHGNLLVVLTFGNIYNIYCTVLSYLFTNNKFYHNTILNNHLVKLINSFFWIVSTSRHD